MILNLINFHSMAINLMLSEQLSNAFRLETYEPKLDIVRVTL